MSESDPQYSRSEFSKFAYEWDFCHVTSSPTYPQSNGLAERTVQTTKRLMKKTTQQTNYDKYGKDLKPRHSGEHVRLRTAGPKPQWEPANVLETPQPRSPRSYIVKSERGDVYQRNHPDNPGYRRPSITPMMNSPELDRQLAKTHETRQA